MYYVIESEGKTATNQPITITFLTNPPKRITIPPAALYDILEKEVANQAVTNHEIKK
jgi:hypothetical protein